MPTPQASNPYLDFMSQTKLLVKGPLKAVKSYTPPDDNGVKQPTYLDYYIDVIGSDAVKIRMPNGFDENSISIGQMVEYACTITYKGTKTTIHGVPKI